jgi:hypothetical protein
LLLMLFCWAGWYLFTFRPWRFLFPVFPLAALAGAWAVDRAVPAVRWAVAGCVGLSLAALAIGPLVSLDDTAAGDPPLSPATYLLGRVGRDDYVRRFNDGSYAPIVWMNRTLPLGATVLYLGEARIYYSTHRVEWSTVYDRHPLQRLRSLDSLRSAGITHVYVNYSEWERLAEGYGYLAELDPRAIQWFLDTRARVVFRNAWSAVYEL